MVTPVSNPPNPWDSTHAEWIGEPPEARLDVYEERAKSIIAENDSPDVGFRFSVNPYRGCFHSCAYCLEGDTPILMGDTSTTPLSRIRVGDEVLGTVLVDRYRRYVRTPVLAHWSRIEPAWIVTLEDGTRLVSSGNHRFLTERGWKHVADRERGAPQRPHLTVQNHLIGTGRFASPPEETGDYRTGYLCGMIRGDALVASYTYDTLRRGPEMQHQFRLAMVDAEALARTERYLLDFEIRTRQFLFQAAVGNRKPLSAIRTHAKASVDHIREIIQWPTDPTSDWSKGFLAGIFDAEGSYSRGILRICNTDPEIVSRVVEALRSFAFDSIVEITPREKPVYVVRVRRGLREHLRFFHAVNPAISRKRSIAGQAIKNDSKLRVVSVEPTGVAMKLYDVTTGTGDFIANGVVSHNCYARSSHEYLGFGAGTDFDRKIVVKTNAPELLQKELERKSWQGDCIAFSGNTDCYQPLEAVYELTRRCLEICLAFRNPVGLITKSALIRRDVSVLAALAREADALVHLSICFADDAMSRAIEPHTSPPSQRFETLRILSDAGIRTGVGVAPVIPGLNDDQVAEILRRARDAGATEAFRQPVRLSGATLPVFKERLEAAFPNRAPKIWNAIQEMRGGKLNETAFGARMRGLGPRWAAVEALYRTECRRLGFNRHDEPDRPRTFRRPQRQATLFGAE